MEFLSGIKRSELREDLTEEVDGVWEFVDVLRGDLRQGVLRLVSETLRPGVPLFLLIDLQGVDGDKNSMVTIDRFGWFSLV